MRCGGRAPPCARSSESRVEVPAGRVRRRRKLPDPLRTTGGQCFVHRMMCEFTQGAPVGASPLPPSASRAVTLQDVGLHAPRVAHGRALLPRTRANGCPWYASTFPESGRCGSAERSCSVGWRTTASHGLGAVNAFFTRSTRIVLRTAGKRCRHFRSGDRSGGEMSQIAACDSWAAALGCCM